MAVEREGRIFGFYATVIERPIAVYDCLNVELVSDIECGEIVRH